MTSTAPSEARHVSRWLIKLGGVGVILLGGWLGWLNGPVLWAVLTSGWHSATAVLLALLPPLIGLGFAIYLFGLAWCLLRRPSLITVCQLGILTWFVLAIPIWHVFLIFEPWIVPDRMEAFRSRVFLVAFVLSAVVCVPSFRWLARAARLLDRHRHWWNRGNIRSLCILAAWGWFLFLLHPTMIAASEWIIEEHRTTFQGASFLGGIVLALLIGQYGPKLLVWLIPPMDVQPNGSERAQQTEG